MLLRGCLAEEMETNPSFVDLAVSQRACHASPLHRDGTERLQAQVDMFSAQKHTGQAMGPNEEDAPPTPRPARSSETQEFCNGL